MALNPVLVIKVMDGNSVGVRARLKDDYVEHEIVLNSVLAYYWANDFPPVVKFLELFESVIKRTINELMPHKNLNLKYEHCLGHLHLLLLCDSNLKYDHYQEKLYRTHL